MAGVCMARESMCDEWYWFMTLQKLLAGFLARGSDIKATGQPVLPLVCISMVKNEQDIIEPFLRNNAKFFDLMIVLDNGSTDKTRDILFDCAREFGNVIVSDQPEAAYR